jgi:hypothetical protein
MSKVYVYNVCGPSTGPCPAHPKIIRHYTVSDVRSP